MILRARVFPLSLVMISLALVFTSTDSKAGVSLKGGAKLLRMQPSGRDVDSDDSSHWGVGLYFLTIPDTPNGFLAGVVGFDYIHMMGRTIVVSTESTRRTEEQTKQDWMRFYLGGRLGYQGTGFLRLYVEADIALNFYRIGTDRVVKDDTDPEYEKRRDLSGDSSIDMGFDLTLGLELRVSKFCYIDLGTKYLESFDRPNQLRGDAAEIYPRYLQFFFGVSIDLDM